MNEEITLMIVDDHQLVREGIGGFFEEAPDITVVASVSNGVDAIKMAEQHLPDVVLMDLNLGEGMNGIEATRQIKTNCPNTQIIVLTSFHSDEHIFPAIKAGALSYLLKDIHPKDLLSAIQKAFIGQSELSPVVAKRIVEEMQPKVKKGVLTPLSEREMQILQLIGQGMTNKEIAEDLTITVKTVKCHVSNILAKLHLRDRTQAAVHAWENGLMK